MVPIESTVTQLWHFVCRTRGPRATSEAAAKFTPRLIGSRKGLPDDSPLLRLARSMDRIPHQRNRQKLVESSSEVDRLASLGRQ